MPAARQCYYLAFVCTLEVASAGMGFCHFAQERRLDSHPSPTDFSLTTRRRILYSPSHGSQVASKGVWKVLSPLTGPREHLLMAAAIF